VDDLLPATGGGIVSVSATHLKFHSAGGLMRASVQAAEVVLNWDCCALRDWDCCDLRLTCSRNPQCCGHEHAIRP